MKDAADVAEDVTNSKPLEIAARAGFAVSGLLHFLIGLVAIRLAMGGQGQADVSGAVEELAGQPAGPLLLWTSFAACVALAIWQTSDAIFDFGHLPTKKKVGKKLKAALQAVVYAAFALTLASVATGAGSAEFENLHEGERAGADSPLTQVWESGVESRVGGAPVKEGRAPVSTEHTGPNEGVDGTGGWAPRFEGRILTSFENKAHEAGRLIFDLSYRRI
jgi:hypothetical protein